MAGNSNLTREFFEKQEVDDTLQRIREQYLASKKNLQVLMKQSDETSTSPKLANEAPVPKDPVSSIKRSNERALDESVLLNEVRSLKRLTVEQQSQVRKLTNELLMQKRTTSELQSKILNLQSQVAFLENHFLNFYENLAPQTNAVPSVHRPESRNYSPAPYSPPIEDNTMRLIQISKPK